MEAQRTPLEAIGELARILAELEDGASLPPREQLAALLDAIHTSDLADLISAAPAPTLLPLFRAIPDDENAAEVLTLLDEGVRESVLEALSVERKAALLQELAHDDAVDVLAEMPDQDQRDVLAELPRGEAEELRNLTQFPPDTAGGRMNDQFVALREQQTARSALMQVKTHEEWEDVTEVFIVDQEDHLRGVVDLDDLLRAGLDQRLGEVMEPVPVAAHVGDSDEEAAQKAAHYRRSMLPVLDEHERLVGVIAYDDLMEVLDEEATEDMLRLAGTLEQNPVRDSLLDRLFSRVPFLLVTILGTYVVAWLVGELADPGPGLAVLRFLPMIAALAGNAGIQASTTMIRGFATGDILAGDFHNMFGREVSLGLVTGLVCAAVEFLLLLAMGEGVEVLRVVPAAQFGAVVMATACGVAVPFFCWRVEVPWRGRTLRMDPALAAGPFITTLNDILSVFLALWLASLMLG